MSSYLTVFIKFILPMVLLCGGGLIAIRLIEKATPKHVAERKRPVLLSLLVALWALGIGGVLFKCASVAVRAVTGNDASTPGTSGESWAWFGVSLLITAVLVAACYALFELRRSAIRLFAIYLLLLICFRAIWCVIYPEATAALWRSPQALGDVILGAVTLGYAYYLKSRAVLA